MADDNIGSATPIVSDDGDTSIVMGGDDQDEDNTQWSMFDDVRDNDALVRRAWFSVRSTELLVDRLNRNSHTAHRAARDARLIEDDERNYESPAELAIHARAVAEAARDAARDANEFAASTANKVKRLREVADVAMPIGDGVVPPVVQAARDISRNAELEIRQALREAKQARWAAIGAETTAAAAKTVAENLRHARPDQDATPRRIYRGHASMDESARPSLGRIVNQLRQTSTGISVFLDEELKFARKGHLAIHVLSAPAIDIRTRDTHFSEIISRTLAVNGARARPDANGWLYGVYIRADHIDDKDPHGRSRHAIAYRFHRERRELEAFESWTGIVDPDIITDWDRVAPTGWLVRVSGDGGQRDDNLCSIHSVQCVVDMVIGRPRQKHLRRDVYARWMSALREGYLTREYAFRQYPTDEVKSITHVTEWRQGQPQDAVTRITRPDSTLHNNSDPSKRSKTVVHSTGLADMKDAMVTPAVERPLDTAVPVPAAVPAAGLDDNSDDDDDDASWTGIGQPTTADTEAMSRILDSLAGLHLNKNATAAAASVVMAAQQNARRQLEMNAVMQRTKSHARLARYWS